MTKETTNGIRYGDQILEALRERGPMTAWEIGWRLGINSASPALRGYLSGLYRSGRIRRDGVRWTVGATDATIRAELVGASGRPGTCPEPIHPPPLDPQYQIQIDAFKVALERQKEETAHAVADACEQAAKARSFDELCTHLRGMIAELVNERDAALKEAKRLDDFAKGVQEAARKDREDLRSETKYRTILEKIIEENADTLASGLLEQIERLCKPSV